jgi:signal recognition particle subunit SEC65
VCAHSPTVPRPLQAYINSKISTAKGRKMPIAHSCEFPTVFEIVEVLKHLGYENPLIEVRPTQRCVCLYGSALVGRAVISRRGSHTLPPQDKTHPRSDFSQRGRVRVELKDPITGDFTVEDIVNRKQLLIKLSEMIPKLKSRKEKPPLDQDGLPPGYPGLQGPVPGMPAEAATPIVSQGSSKKKGKKK